MIDNSTVASTAEADGRPCCVYAQHPVYAQHHDHMVNLSSTALAEEFIDLAFEYDGSEGEYQWIDPESYPAFVVDHDFEERSSLYRIAGYAKSIWKEQLQDEVADLRESLATEVRTRRLVVTDEDGAEGIVGEVVTDAHNQRP